MPASATGIRARPCTREPAFTKFPELPTDLRLKIWGYASNVTRALELVYCMVDRKFFTFQHVPSVLHTNSESREVGLQHDHLSFETDKTPPRTYFNPEKDIVYFGTRQCLDDIGFMMKYFAKAAANFEPRDQIQYLALTEDLWKGSNESSLFYKPFRSIRRTGRLFKTFFTAFPCLKHLYLLAIQTSKSPLVSRLRTLEDYSGISLLPSENEERVMKNRGLCVNFYPHYLKGVPQGKSRPKLAFMRYGFAG